MHFILLNVVSQNPSHPTLVFIKCIADICITSHPSLCSFTEGAAELQHNGKNALLVRAGRERKKVLALSLCTQIVSMRCAPNHLLPSVVAYITYLEFDHSLKKFFFFSGHNFSGLPPSVWCPGGCLCCLSEVWTITSLQCVLGQKFHSAVTRTKLRCMNFPFLSTWTLLAHFQILSTTLMPPGIH